MTFEDRLLLIDNARLEGYYSERLMNLALSQFIYEDTPERFDRVFFESKLLFEGKACLMIPEGGDEWLSIGFVNSGGALDVYGYPRDITGVGYGVANIIPAKDKWQVIYDNPMRTSIVNGINLYASLLAECHAVFRQNLQKQTTPYLLTGSQYQEKSFKSIFMKLFSHAPYIMLKKQADKEAIDVLDLKVNFYGKELLECLKILWDEALEMLGISPSTLGGLNEKKERLLNQELDMAREEQIIARGNRELQRREFCKKVNKRFGLNMSVHMCNAQDLGLPTDAAQAELDRAYHGDTNAEKGEN